MEARAYDTNGSTVARHRQRRPFLSRFIRAKSELAPTPIVVEVGPEEFTHFEECMNNPQGPTLTLTKGAELLRSLWPKSR